VIMIGGPVPPPTHITRPSLARSPLHPITAGPAGGPGTVRDRGVSLAGGGTGLAPGRKLSGFGGSALRAPPPPAAAAGPGRGTSQCEGLAWASRGEAAGGRRWHPVTVTASVDF
jgi:hypothetical protein